MSPHLWRDHDLFYYPMHTNILNISFAPNAVSDYWETEQTAIRNSRSTGTEDEQRFWRLFERYFRGHGKAQQFVGNLSYEEFKEDDKTVFAIIRALEIVGEAAKKIPNAMRTKYDEIPWKDMAGMRDVLIHDYFGVDVETIWLTVSEKIPRIKPLIQKMLEELWST